MAGARERIDRAEAALQGIVGYLRPRDDSSEIVSALVKHFGSPGAVIEAGKHQLVAQGLSERDALLISMIPDIIRHMERQRFGDHPAITTLLEAEKYLSMRYIGFNIERFYMLALDSSGRLIECVHLQSGNEDSAPFYLKHVLSEIVRTEAQSIVISHNHPNSTPRPSQADIDCTLALIEALTTVGTPIIDHIIMVGKRALSMRGFGFIPEYVWRNQTEGEVPYRGWLEGWSFEETADVLALNNDVEDPDDECENPEE